MDHYKFTKKVEAPHGPVALLTGWEIADVVDQFSGHSQVISIRNCGRQRVTQSTIEDL